MGVCGKGSHAVGRCVAFLLLVSAASAMSRSQLSMAIPVGTKPIESLKHEPAFSVLNVQLPPGCTIKAESGAMVCMQSVNVDTELGGPKAWRGQQTGCLTSMVRAVMGGQSLFVTTFTGGGEGGGWVWLAPHGAGDIEVLDIEPDREVYIQRGSYLGSWYNAQTATRTFGLKGLLSGEGFFFLRAFSNDGERSKVYVSSFGGIEKFLVKKGEELVIDTGHVVAFEDTLHFTVEGFNRRLGSMLLSGEGFVCRFTVRDRGDRTAKEGHVWVQTRTPVSPVGRAGKDA